MVFKNNTGLGKKIRRSMNKRVRQEGKREINGEDY